MEPDNQTQLRASRELAQLLAELLETDDLAPLTCREISSALGVRVTKATQAWPPARRKAALMLLAAGPRAWAELVREMMAIAAERAYENRVSNRLS